MLSDALHNLATLFPDHLVLLTGSAPSLSLRNRQFESDPDFAPPPGPVVPQSLPPLENATSQVVAPSNVTFGGTSLPSRPRLSYIIKSFALNS